MVSTSVSLAADTNSAHSIQRLLYLFATDSNTLFKGINGTLYFQFLSEGRQVF